MKEGIISESILKRSVIKQIKYHRQEVLQGAGIGIDCALLSIQEDEIFLVSTDSVIGTVDEIGEHGISLAMNDIAAGGGTPIAVLVSLLLPRTTYESDIQNIMHILRDKAKEIEVQIVGGDTKVTSAVSKIIVSFTAIGKAKREKISTYHTVSPGQDIVVTKTIGIHGTSKLFHKKEADLQKLFPAYFIENGKRLGDNLSIIEEAATAIRSDACTMHDLSSGGIFAGLWEIAEAAGVGLEVDLKQIPIKQETVEVCEVFSLNPYELLSDGSLLIICNNGAKMVESLNEVNIQATVIGKIKEGKEKIIRNDDEIRYLDRPKSDEIYAME